MLVAAVDLLSIDNVSNVVEERAQSGSSGGTLRRPVEKRKLGSPRKRLARVDRVAAWAATINLSSRSRRLRPLPQNKPVDNSAVSWSDSVNGADCFAVFIAP